jgi:hypothetical protein
MSVCLPVHARARLAGCPAPGVAAAASSSSVRRMEASRRCLCSASSPPPPSSWVCLSGSGMPPPHLGACAAPAVRTDRKTDGNTISCSACETQQGGGRRHTPFKGLLGPGTQGCTHRAPERMRLAGVRAHKTASGWGLGIGFGARTPPARPPSRPPARRPACPSVYIRRRQAAGSGHARQAGLAPAAAGGSSAGRGAAKGPQPPPPPTNSDRSGSAGAATRAP